MSCVLLWRVAAKVGSGKLSFEAEGDNAYAKLQATIDEIKNTYIYIYIYLGSFSINS